MIDAADLAAMQAIVSARWQVEGPYVEEHAGGLAWGANPVREDADMRWFGDDAGVFVDGEDWRVFAAPGADHRYAEIAAAAREEGAPVLALGHEESKVAALLAAGFTRDDAAWYWHLVHDLSDLPPVPLPPGSTLANGEDDLDARVAVHRAAWDPSRFTRSLYDVIRATPPYRPEHDVAVVAGDGTWAGYCLAWYDPLSASGELEPVGTHPAFRRQGYGAAACLEALRRLRAAGATTAVVYAVSDPRNPGPRALYESIGFVSRDRHARYRPPMRENPASTREALR